ncbi:hypothetical protein [Alicyclobacillus shizuokensis]|uniref:hypothetical protein n=1 Tax=Alicyclobacillus shizuokensis TaxID=392014 RepID=UPI000836FFE4|nr:hypothetical protein [Alicyclobacillus shizuokensis]MCL6626295.1 hypothetical protein [Alicyclobacillus shizuokensis]
MNRIDHQAFFDTDLPRIEEEMGDDAKFAEFLECLDKAIDEIMRDPANEGAPLQRPPLAPTYRKKKFHSVRRPPRGQKADMRLVYRCDLTANTLYVFGVGKRRPYQDNDIYALLNPRSPI